jgi:hypothetical protein
MSLLGGGIASAFSSLIGSGFTPGTLNRSGWEDDDKGVVTRTATEEAIRVQVDQATWAQRQSDSFTARSVRLIIMQLTPSGDRITRPGDQDTVTVDGGPYAGTYRLANITGDTAGSHWEAIGTPTPAP